MKHKQIQNNLEQIIESIHNDIKYCPFCGSKEVFIRNEKTSTIFCVIDLECVDCFREWSENYELKIV